MSEFDAVIVGASLAGSAAAKLLGEQGKRVALVEKAPDPQHFKRVCGHFIQASGVPTFERLGVLDAMRAAGGVDSHSRIRTRYGLIESDRVPASFNIRREKLDPIMRAAAAATPGVELLLGETVTELLPEGGVRLRGGRELRAPLTIGADGRDSAVARLAGLEGKTVPNARFSYGAYYEGPPPAGAPDGTVWLLDPHWVAAFPTDDGLTLYAAMLTREHLAEWKGDTAAALEAFVASVPDAPPIRESRRVGDVIGKVKMDNRIRGPIADRVALIGDAALATDPLWGVGCGWAVQSAEWLADALAGAPSLERGLRHYQRTWTRRLAPHMQMIHGYSNGRAFNGMEKRLYATAATDPVLAERMGRVGVRLDSPLAMMRPSTVWRLARGPRRKSAGYSSTTRTSPSLTA